MFQSRTIFAVIFAFAVLIFLYETRCKDKVMIDGDTMLPTPSTPSSTPTSTPSSSPTSTSTPSTPSSPISTLLPSITPSTTPSSAPMPTSSLSPASPSSTEKASSKASKSPKAPDASKSPKSPKSPKAPKASKLSPDPKVQAIHDTIALRERAERLLQKKYSLGFGKYKYDFVPNEYPLNGLGPDYDRQRFSTLPQNCNKMLVVPDLNFPYSNLLSRVQ